MLYGSNISGVSVETLLARLDRSLPRSLTLLLDPALFARADGEQPGLGQEQAAAALANLAKDSADNRKSIVVAGGIAPLLSLLSHESMR